MLSVELNDRERPASPGPSPLLERKADHVDSSKPKQWRLKIEEWLQENEKEQKREKTLRDKIAFERLKRENEKITSGEEKSADKGLATLQEAKTDSEIYSKKSKVLKPTETEIAECMPLKDKSKWRKSNLNVANSSESIDDERRKSRSRRNASDTEMDTISFYIARSADNLIPCDNVLVLSGDKAAPQNIACSRKDQQEQKELDKTIIESIDTNPGILIGRSRFYQTMEAPNKMEPIYNKNVSEVQGSSYKNDCESKRSEDNMPTDREDVNFDRFSHMRKTTRRGKSRNRAGENENRKSEDLLDGDLKVNSQEIQAVCSQSQKSIDMDSKLPESNTERQNWGEEKVKNSGSLFNKYAGENGECGEEQKRKDKSMSLKAKLSKRLLSLTENLKVVAKPVDTAQSFEDKKNNLINDSSCQRIDKMLSERRASLNEEKTNPILEHREKILSRPHQDLVQIPVKSKAQATCSPIIISKSQFFKGSYASDSNNVPTAPETPTTPDVKVLEVYPLQKGREECEKDEGFEETQSQLSEVASQGAGSSYDTDLADSPRSLRQMKDANTGKAAENSFSNLIPSSVHSSRDKTPVDSKKDEKMSQENQILDPSQPALNSYQSREATIAREPPKRVTLSKSNSVRMPVSKAGIGRNNLRATLSSATTKDSAIKPQMPANLRTSSQSSRGKVSSSDSKITKKPSLRGLGNLIETSPKIGRRVAAYTKAIKSMTHNLQDSKKFENYDVTQSMPPTPSEEKKTFTSGLQSMANGKKARSSSSVYSPRPHSRHSTNACLGPQSRRGSEKSIASDKSLNLSRKSSEASVITVKSATRSPVPTIRHPKRTIASPSRLTSPTKTKTRIIRPKSPIQTKQLRVPNSLKPVTRTNSVPKQTSSSVLPNLAVRRTSSERASFTFMKATSASSAKSSPTKWTHGQNKFKSPNNQRPTSKPISLAPSQSRIKQRY